MADPAQGAGSALLKAKNFRLTTSLSGMLARTAAAVSAGALLFAGSAAAASLPSQPVSRAGGHVLQTPFTSSREPARLTKASATRLFLSTPKVADWVGRGNYPVAI